MTKQEMKKFAQEQVEWYTKEIEWNNGQIAWINDQLKRTRKEDREQKVFAQTYNDGEYAKYYEGNYQGQETKKLLNLRRKYQREIKKYQANITKYQQDVIKYSEEETTNEEENTMKYDNCKSCGNIHCEHYGKDREFVCPKGISCKTEKVKNTKTYIIKCTQFHVDDNFNLIGDPIIREFSGSSLGEAKAAWRMAKDNNDMTKFSALDVYDIIIPEEE